MVKIEAFSGVGATRSTTTDTAGTCRRDVQEKTEKRLRQKTRREGILEWREEVEQQ